MDHHCPWINTCCGHFNHGNFTYFLFFAPCGCIHALFILIPSIYKALNFVSLLTPVWYTSVSFLLYCIEKSVKCTQKTVVVLFSSKIYSLSLNKKSDQTIKTCYDIRMGSLFCYWVFIKIPSIIIPLAQKWYSDQNPLNRNDKAVIIHILTTPSLLPRGLWSPCHFCWGDFDHFKGIMIKESFFDFRDVIFYISDMVSTLWE